MSKKFIVCSVIEADKPTINGRIYTRAALEKAVSEYNARGETVVTAGFEAGLAPRLIDAVGLAKDFRLTEEGKISAKIRLLPNALSGSAEKLEGLLNLFDFSPMSCGTERADGVIEDLKFSYFALTPKESK